MKKQRLIADGVEKARTHSKGIANKNLLRCQGVLFPPHPGGQALPLPPHAAIGAVGNQNKANQYSHPIVNSDIGAQRIRATEWYLSLP